MSPDPSSFDAVVFPIAEDGFDFPYPNLRTQEQYFIAYSTENVLGHRKDPKVQNGKYEKEMFTLDFFL